MTTNEELVAAVQAGDHDALLELWGQVRRLVLKEAHRWAVFGSNGVDAEDLVQVGFVAVLRAADSYSSDGGAKFTTYLFPILKTEFIKACGLRTQRDKLDPMQNAVSLSAPIGEGEDGDPFTLEDVLDDPDAAAALEAVAEDDQRDRLRTVLEEAVAGLTPEQREAVRRRYYRQEPPLPPGTARLQDNAAHDAALKRLRHPSVSRRLRAAME